MTTETWVRPRPELKALKPDALLAVGLALAALTTAQLYDRLGMFEEPAAPWVWAVSIGLATLPLAVRRRYPVPVAIAVGIGFFIAGQFGVPEALVLQITMFMAVYSVGAWEPNRALALWARVGIVVAMIAWLVIVLLLASSDLDYMPNLARSSVFSGYVIWVLLQIITNLLFFVGASFFGEHAWRSARLIAQLEAQGKELDLERQTSATQAVALDRLTIARELHDVIAHHVSVMGLHAAAARRTLETHPDKAAAALEIVEESASSTITELRQLVHTLRTPGHEHDMQTVGVAQLTQLVDGSNLAGVPTTLIVAGEPRPLPLLIDVALYRVAQEALTNVRKHAGTGAAAEIRLRFYDDSVEVEVSDTGIVQKLGATEDQLGGLGLKGMRERIGAVGGTLTAGRRERGGFMVRATVPLARSATPEPTDPTAVLAPKGTSPA